MGPHSAQSLQQQNWCKKLMLLPAMQFPLFPTADKAVSYFTPDCFNISQPNPMYISTTGEGQGGRREATNKTELGLKRQSQFCMFNSTARKADVEQCSQSGHKPKPVQNELALQRANTANQQQLKREISGTAKAPCLTLAGTGRRAGKVNMLPSQPAWGTQKEYTHVLGTASCWHTTLIFLWVTTDEVMSFKATNVRVSYFN